MKKPAAFDNELSEQIKYIAIGNLKNYGRSTESITCTTPLLAGMFTAIILDGVVFLLPFTVALAALILTLAVFAVATFPVVKLVE